jgi:flagellar biosynthesis/type III secretory pathway protein FliH
MTANGQVEGEKNAGGSGEGALQDEAGDGTGEEKSSALVAASGAGVVVPAVPASVTNIARRAVKPVASGAVARTTLTPSELDKAREEIINKQLPPDLPPPIKALLRKLLPEEILQFKSMMELVYTQAAASAGEEGYKRGAEEGAADAFERGKMQGDKEGLERGKAGMLEVFKPMVAVTNAADSWVDNLPRMSTDKPGVIENQEVAQAAIMGLVETVMKYRQSRLPPA